MDPVAEGRNSTRSETRRVRLSLCQAGSKAVTWRNATKSEQRRGVTFRNQSAMDWRAWTRRTSGKDGVPLQYSRLWRPGETRKARTVVASRRPRFRQQRNRLDGFHPGTVPATLAFEDRGTPTGTCDLGQELGRRGRCHTQVKIPERCPKNHFGCFLAAAGEGSSDDDVDDDAVPVPCEVETMDTLTRMRAFISVVENEGFSAAARKTGRSKALLSKYVHELEDELGALLINRTTRQIGLTAAGEVYLSRASEILADLESLNEEAREATGEAKGTIRVSAARTFGDGRTRPQSRRLRQGPPGDRPRHSSRRQFRQSRRRGLRCRHPA